MNTCTTGFTEIVLGDSDDRALGEIRPEEGLAVYVAHIFRNLLIDYNTTQPDLSPAEWLCQQDTLLVLLPESHDEFTQELAAAMGLTLQSVHIHDMCELANQEIRRIGALNQSDLAEVRAIDYMPDAPALAFERAA